MSRAIALAAPIAVAALLAAPPARADEPLPPVADVVQKARAVMEKKPSHVVCSIAVDTDVLDKTGKLEHSEKREGKATLDGDDQDVESTRVVRDGKAMSADELAAERENAKKQRAKQQRKKGDGDFELSPLAPKNAPKESFELVRRETLWGRPAFVLNVRANGKGDTLANGTLWIDAKRFIELKGELEPAQLPDHVDWLKLQEQYLLAPSGAAVPSLVHVEGAGHFLFIHKRFRSTLRWSDCR